MEEMVADASFVSFWAPPRPFRCRAAGRSWPSGESSAHCSMALQGRTCSSKDDKHNFCQQAGLRPSPRQRNGMSARSGEMEGGAPSRVSAPGGGQSIQVLIE